MRSWLTGVVEVLEARKLMAVTPASPAVFDLPNALPRVIPTFDIVSGSAAVTTIMNHGNSSNRIDLVLVGDGFTQSDLPLFARDSANFVGQFFNQAPLSSYKTYFNVHRVDVISEMSGVSGDPFAEVYKSTALSMSYFGAGIERLLTVDVSAALAYSSLAPDVQQTIAIANSDKYGGAGYSQSDVLTIAGQNLETLEIARHEFGHSFGNLADEYDYGGPAAYAGDEPFEPNVSTLDSTQMLAQQAKWYRWLGTRGVGTFRGAYYSRTGVYRPTSNSKMRELNQPYGPVNTEALVLEMYKVVRPIDSSTPAGTYGQDTTLQVVPLRPTDHSLAIQWYLDGQPIAGATREKFYVSSLKPLAGDHSIRVKVVDTTAMVRDESARETLLSDSREWTIHVAPSTIRGRIYQDTNINGGLDPLEPGIGEVKVFIDANRNGKLDAGESSTITDSTGKYEFANLPVGTFCVREIPPAGYRPAYPTDGAREVKVGVGQIVENQNLGNTRNVLIAGSVFNDANRDGIRQAGESSMALWRVFIDLNNNGVLDSTEPAKLTDSSGAYSFQGLSAGTYVVRIVAQSPWAVRTPATAFYRITLNAGQASINRDFALVK